LEGMSANKMTRFPAVNRTEVGVLESR